MTEAEAYLWKRLEHHSLMPGWVPQWKERFYTLDFYHPIARVCVEIDGYHHWRGKQAAHDLRRFAYLRKNYRLEELRFSNRQTLERTDLVVAEILGAYLRGMHNRTESDGDWYRRIGSSIR